MPPRTTNPYIDDAAAVAREGEESVSSDFEEDNYSMLSII